MKIKQIRLADYFVKGLWVEGVELVGYSKRGDSFLFSQKLFEKEPVFICISKSFLKELLRESSK